MSLTLPSNNDCICHPSAKLPNFGTIYQCNITIWGKTSWIFFFFRYCVCDRWAIWHWHWWKVEPMDHGQDEEGQGMKYLDPETQPHERTWSPSRPRSTPGPTSDDNKVMVFCDVKLNCCSKLRKTANCDWYSIQRMVTASFIRDPRPEMNCGNRAKYCFANQLRLKSFQYFLLCSIVAHLLIWRKIL